MTKVVVRCILERKGEDMNIDKLKTEENLAWKRLKVAEAELQLRNDEWETACTKLREATEKGIADVTEKITTCEWLRTQGVSLWPAN